MQEYANSVEDWRAGKARFIEAYRPGGGSQLRVLTAAKARELGFDCALYARHSLIPPKDSDLVVQSQPGEIVADLGTLRRLYDHHMALRDGAKIGDVFETVTTVNGYEVEEVNATGIVIGCQFFHAEEIDYVAEQLGWTGQLYKVDVITVSKEKQSIELMAGDPRRALVRALQRIEDTDIVRLAVEPVPTNVTSISKKK